MKQELQEKMQKLTPSAKFPFTNYILIAILILGFVLRIYKINAMPLYGDELTIVYDSYSILKTGRDQTGEFFPVTFKLGAGRPAGYVYGSIPFVALFGPSVGGVRGLSLLSGLGIIILMYFLGKKLFDPQVGLIASFLTSISMWDIYLSRAGYEAHFALFLTLLGVVLFLHKKWIPMALSFGLAAFTYPTFKLTIPLLGILLVLLNGFKSIVTDKKFISAFLVLLVFAGFSFRETIKGVSEARFLRLNVLSDIKLKEEITQIINEQRKLSTLPLFAKELMYNKPFRYTRILFENYVSNLSPEFLYLRGDRNPRHNPGEWGMLYLVEIPLLFIGLYFLTKLEKKNLMFLIAWVLIVPLATMLLDQTHALRNNLMLPPLILITAYALYNLPKVISSFAVLIMMVQLSFVLMTIYFFAPYKFGSFWSIDAKNASLSAMGQDKNKEVILSTKTGDIEYAYPVYAKVDPRLVISQYQKWPKVYGNVKIINE